jgi:ATP-dependent DNA helicase RecG
MAHPDYIVPKKDLVKIQTIDRTYPLVGGLTQKFVKKIIDVAIGKAPDLPEWIDKSVIKQEGWESWKESIKPIHFPKINPSDDMGNIYRRRLAYDELLANQIAMKIVRGNIKNADGRVVKIRKNEDNLCKKLMKNLGFELTNGQKEVLQEIFKDLASLKKMLRLLQGDVGSGKTVVALLSMLAVIEDRKQAVIMVPTGILANQHYEWISKVCEGLDVNIGLLTGKVKGKKREKILEDVKNGEIDILVGTHALVQDWVKFHDLALVVIDEQHKFGVLQRLALTEKGNKPDVLLMTATPIPRTLTLTIYGDTDVSSLREKPINRKPIDTKIMSNKKIRNVVDGLKRVLEKGEKVFWVCPLIEESEESYMANVEDRFQKFKKVFGEDTVGLIHGKMKADAKEKIMESFFKSDGKIKILIATTVVEVGVDVPDATVMVIENTEHFGLSQLHQLRGRVGRSDKKSYCILLYGRVGDAGVKRLEIMRKTNDGFLIAEEDLKIRGAGEMLGTKQSGLPSYKVANLNCDYDLLNKASQDARLFLEKDSAMTSERGKAVRILLYLFGYDSSLKLTV